VNHRNGDRILSLSKEEALGLLELVMLTPGEFTPDQRAAVLKLGEFCRTFLTEDGDRSVPPERASSGLPSNLYVA
jgi:hypothetical protein